MSFTIFGIILSADVVLSTNGDSLSSVGGFCTNFEGGGIPLLEEIKDGTAAGGAGDEEVVGRGGRLLTY